MTAVFLGGSRAISRLNPEVRARLDNMIRKQLHILVGDANGADKAMQEHLATRGYRDVEVFCVGACRNNVGDWHVHVIAAESSVRDFAFYATKDRAMSQTASVGFMLWDGKSVGTLLNLFRLITNNKRAVVYVSPERRFFELRDLADWKRFLDGRNAEMRRKLEQRAALEAPEPAQASLAL